MNVKLMTMDMLQVISKRRDGLSHTREELTFIAEVAARGTAPDYQLSAWLMAAYLNPLTAQETAWLTQAMAQTGERVDLSGLPRPWVDKHSTGGVGDKTTMVLLPMLAACGLTVVKMSGRGLGITGGTVDKLSSIPGFRLDLSPEELKTQAGEIGLALTGQSPNLAPADKALYALRDATATVSSIPLIVSSILSKKIAGGAEVLALDVKCGSGALVKDFESARQLARLLKETAELAGLKVRLAITDMTQPLGRCVGNALEVREASEVLNGSRSRFAQLCIHLAGMTLHAAGLASSQPEGEKLAEQSLLSGAALEKAKAWLSAQGGDSTVLDEPERLGKAPVQQEFLAEKSGHLARLEAGIVGQTVVELGGGRMRKEDTIDPVVGIECLASLGTLIEAGSTLMRVHARTRKDAERAAEHLRAGIEVSDQPVQPPPLILEML